MENPLYSVRENWKAHKALWTRQRDFLRLLFFLPLFVMLERLFTDWCSTMGTRKATSLEIHYALRPRSQLFLDLLIGFTRRKLAMFLALSQTLYALCRLSHAFQVVWRKKNDLTRKYGPQNHAWSLTGHYGHWFPKKTTTTSSWKKKRLSRSISCGRIEPVELTVRVVSLWNRTTNVVATRA